MEELRSLNDLLDLQQVDTQIDRLIEQRQNLPALEEYRTADATLRGLVTERDPPTQIRRDPATDERSECCTGGSNAEQESVCRRPLRSFVVGAHERVDGGNDQG